MYDLAALDAELAGTLFAGKLNFARVTGSTNADAIAAARRGAPHGSVFLADEQTAAGGAAITVGSPLLAKGFTSASFSVRKFPPRACRFCRWPRAWPLPKPFAPSPA